MLDLKALLAKILSKGEYKTLLWTNPNPTRGFSTTTILNGQDLTIYDEIEVYGINYTTYTSVMPTVKVPRGEKGNLIGLAGSSGDSTGTGFLVARGIRFNDTNILINNAAGVATNGESWYINNNNMIPIKIYGIKYGGGYLISNLILSSLLRGWHYVRPQGVAYKNIGISYNNPSENNIYTHEGFIIYALWRMLLRNVGKACTSPSWDKWVGCKHWSNSSNYAERALSTIKGICSRNGGRYELTSHCGNGNRWNGKSVPIVNILRSRPILHYITILERGCFYA